MAENPPYILSPKTLKKGLDKIRAAATPDRFTSDFLANTLGMKGGSAKPMIPFLKRIGFLNSDGTPSELYKQFRNVSHSGTAAAKAIRIGYQALFAKNEDADTIADSELKGLVVEATGFEESSRAVGAIVSSFRVLKEYAKPGKIPKGTNEDGPKDAAKQDAKEDAEAAGEDDNRRVMTKLGLSYTINLNLPATSDITVFNAIFKALKDNLLEH